MLVHRSLDFQEFQSAVDDEVHFVFIYCRLYTVECIIAMLYIPPPFCLMILFKLVAFTLSKADVPLYIMGDFNGILNYRLDRHPPAYSRPFWQGYCTIQFSLRLGVGGHLETEISRYNPIFMFL